MRAAAQPVSLSHTRRALHLSVVMLMMMETLRRFIASPAYSISLWAMELLVLGLIAYEVILPIRRRKIVGKRLKAIHAALVKGQNLQNEAVSLRSNESSAAVLAWRDSVNAWIRDTQGLLRGYSPQAEASFLHDTHYITANSPILSAPADYNRLVMRVNNLREIMEKPDVYF